MADTVRPHTGRLTALRARAEGVVAARDGKDVTACPYNPGGNFTDRLKARFWILGFNRARVVQTQLAAAPPAP